MEVKKFFTAAVTLLAFFIILVVAPASAKDTSKSSSLKESTKQTVSTKKSKDSKAEKKVTKSSTRKEQTARTQGAKPAAIQKVNINRADLKTLTTLKGIGDKRAKAIIEYRKKNGHFKKTEDIMQVEGVGEKIFEKNISLIKVK